MPRRFAPYYALLCKNPAFRRLYVAQLVSFAGDWFATVALLGLALELSGSEAVASLVLVLQTGAFAVTTPLAGSLADRVDRKRLLVMADLARVPVCLGFLLARTPDTLWIALACTALLAAMGAFFEPASSAALPNLVEDEDLPTANVLIGSAWGVMLAVGAAIGGIVAATFGRDAAFIVDAATFAVSAVLIIGIMRPFQRPREPAAHGEATGLIAAIRPVVRFARHSRFVASLLLSKTMFGVGTGVVLMLAVFADEVYRAGDVGIGILFAARGLGALIGPSSPAQPSEHRITGCWSVSPCPFSSSSSSPMRCFRWRRPSGWRACSSSPPTLAAARSGCSRPTACSVTRPTRFAAACSASTSGSSR